MASTVIPTLRYQDSRRAIEFLVEAFGFEIQAVFEDEDGSILHAQLSHGDGMIMLGDNRESEWGRLVTSVAAAGKPTSGAYVVVDDAFAHAERARQAGAEIVREPATADYGGAGYTARDPEGNLWDFGSYDPWAT
jgi:uncharacterized glyoxalase superfamily protein PhnB